jgi:hypothetical protein
MAHSLSNVNTAASLFEGLSCLFANDVERLFVGAQPKEGGMPHFALSRPLGEFYLAYSLGLSHVVAFSSFTFWSKGFLSVRSGCIV